MIDMNDEAIFNSGFLLASASVGMRLSDPLLQTYVRHDATATSVVTLRQWSLNAGEYVTARLRVLRNDEVVLQRDVAFEGDPAMPEAPADRMLIAAVPHGMDDPQRCRAMVEAMLAGCRAIAAAA